MKKILLLLIIFSLLSCNKTISFDETIVIEGIVYAKDQKKPFTGIIYEEFDSSIKSGEYNFVDGILFGDWKTFDHTGDIVQEGRYIKDTSITEFVSSNLNISNQDISICLFEEGNFHFLEIRINAKVIKKSSAFKIATDIKSSLLNSYQVDEKEIIFDIDDNSSFVF